VEFRLRGVKHEQWLRAKAFKKPHSISHSTCVSNVGTKSSVGVDSSCSKSQGTSHKRMVFCPLGLCLSIGLCTIALFVGRMGIKRAFATSTQGKCGELVLLGLWLFIALLMA
jgi:hypothetical protein